MGNEMFQLTVDTSFFECPVCLNILQPPVWQCKNGHTVCSQCKMKLDSCPTCRTQLKHYKNLLLQKILDMVPIPCKNQKNGCTVAMPKNELQNHECDCVYRIVKCVSGVCSHQEIIFVNCVHHYQKHHFIYGGLHYGKPAIWTIKSKIGYCILANESELFYFTVWLDDSSPRKTFCSSVHYIGPARDSKKYVYSIQVKQGILSLSCTNFCLPYMDDYSEIKNHPLSYVVDKVGLEVGYDFSVTITLSENNANGAECDDEDDEYDRGGDDEYDTGDDEYDGDDVEGDKYNDHDDGGCESGDDQDDENKYSQEHT